MTRFPVLLLAVVLSTAPWLAGRYGLVPDSDQTSLAQPIIAALLCACIAAAGVLTLLRRGRDAVPMPLSLAQAVFLALVSWAAVSVLARALSQGSAAFLGQMTHAWALLAAQAGVFGLARILSRHTRASGYALVLAAAAGAATAAALGANEYLTHLRAHEPDWRAFGPSTPDFLAGYLALMLPVTIALFLNSPAGGPLPLLLGLVTLIDLAAMLTTGSRFALISLAAGLLVFGGGLWTTARRGLPLAPAARRRLITLAVLAALAAAAVARPVLHRVLGATAADNSTLFRLWTWRGVWRMALAHPLFGTGIGAWTDTYPHYALTGFTRLAHTGYGQMADECGFAGLALLLALLVVTFRAGVRGLRLPPSVPNTQPSWLASVAGDDDRLLRCGLLASVAAGTVQNVNDSDWSVFFIGVTFWALAGLLVGFAGEGTDSRPVPPKWRTVAACASALLLAYFAAQTVAAGYGKAAREATLPADAETNYLLAGAWDTLAASPRSDLGYNIYGREGRFADAEALVREAVARQPNAFQYRRLGTILAAQGKRDAALAAYREGLRADPHALDLLTALAAQSPPPANLGYYAQIAALEQSPVGRVRAIGGVAEVRFAVADAALADAGVKTDPARAQTYYVRAAALLEAYADEGGSANPQRRAMTGGHADPAQDTQMTALYAHVAGQIVQLAPPANRTALQARTAIYAKKYAALIK